MITVMGMYCIDVTALYQLQTIFD